MGVTKPKEELWSLGSARRHLGLHPLQPVLPATSAKRPAMGTRPGMRGWGRRGYLAHPSPWSRSGGFGGAEPGLQKLGLS